MMLVSVCCARAVFSLKCVYVLSYQMEIIMRSFNLFCILILSTVLVVVGSAGSTGECAGECWEYWGVRWGCLECWGVLGALGSAGECAGGAWSTGECWEHWGVLGVLGVRWGVLGALGSAGGSGSAPVSDGSTGECWEYWECCSCGCCCCNNIQLRRPELPVRR